MRRVEATRDEVVAADAVVLLVDHGSCDLASVERYARYALDIRHCHNYRHVEHM